MMKQEMKLGLWPKKKEQKQIKNKMYKPSKIGYTMYKIPIWEVLLMKKSKIFNVLKSIFFILLLCLILLFNIMTTALGNSQTEPSNKQLGKVTVDQVNIRQGPGTQYSTMGTQKKGQLIKIIGTIDNWYVVQLLEGQVGCVKQEYIQIIQQEQAETKEIQTSSQISYTKDKSTELTDQEKYILDTVNNQRKQQNLSVLEIDDDLQNIARLKAMEMGEKQYFSHLSPEYGSLYDMMELHGITYQKAAENIAGNPDINSALMAWSDSPGHQQYILDAEYTHTGVGIASHPIYGKVYVQMFMEK